MKIEKVNENQIRCTLSKEDLEDRQIKLSELAYGSEKAKVLFRDMIQQANYEFGFEADDAPIMVEAIPISGDHIILQITKVEYPDELDTRFSKFSESDEEDEETLEGNPLPKASGADDVLEVFRKLKKGAKDSKEAEREIKSKEAPMDTTAPEKEVEIPTDLVKMFEFTNMDDLKRVAGILSSYYFGTNSVYKDLHKNRYYLFVHKSQHTPEEFNKVCNVISEYGILKKYHPATLGYLREHGKLLISEQALQIIHSL